MDTAHLLAQLSDLRAELSRTQHELGLWKSQLHHAQKEILRAQQVVDQVDRARADAEERSHRYRNTLRRLLEDRAVQLARDEGRRLGYREGFQLGATHRQPRPPVSTPPDQIRPHTDNHVPPLVRPPSSGASRQSRMTLPERIADQWRSQNPHVQTPIITTASFFHDRNPLKERSVSNTTTPNIAVEAPSISPSNNTERTVVDAGLLSSNQPMKFSSPFRPSAPHHPPGFSPLSPIPALSSLAAIPESTHTRSPSTSSRSDHLTISTSKSGASPILVSGKFTPSDSSTASFPNTPPSSVPVPGASSVDSRDG